MNLVVVIVSLAVLVPNVVVFDAVVDVSAIVDVVDFIVVVVCSLSDHMLCLAMNSGSKK